MKTYLSIVLGALGLLAVQSVMPANYSWNAPYIYISFALAGIVSLLVVGLNRKQLDVAQTFPELLRFPLMKRLFGE
jgi:hypothetical protein